jgi:hypothetical protein
MWLGMMTNPYTLHLPSLLSQASESSMICLHLSSVSKCCQRRMVAKKFSVMRDGLHMNKDIGRRALNQLSSIIE